ncbi:hypothetical protein Trydic_g20666 [Trypoxylus dichotomus]
MRRKIAPEIAAGVNGRRRKPISCDYNETALGALLRKKTSKNCTSGHRHTRIEPSKTGGKCCGVSLVNIHIPQRLDKLLCSDMQKSGHNSNLVTSDRENGQTGTNSLVEKEELGIDENILSKVSTMSCEESS